MADPKALAAIVDALARHLPAGADLAGVALDVDGTTARVRIRSATPALIIGRRNSTVDMIRDELEALEPFDRVFLELELAE